jgi:hypothetical protein
MMGDLCVAGAGGPGIAAHLCCILTLAIVVTAGMMARSHRRGRQAPDTPPRTHSPGA